MTGGEGLPQDDRKRRAQNDGRRRTQNDSQSLKTTSKYCPLAKRMIEITSKPLSPQAIIAKVKKDDYGAVVTFIGTVRSRTRGRKVAALEIAKAEENAEAKLNQVVFEVKQKWQLQHIAISRRIDKLSVGEIALVIAVAAPHRQEAFQACEYAVDRLKQGGITTEKEIYETGDSQE